MINKEFLGKKFDSTLKYSITILGIDKEIPDDQLDNFYEWINYLPSKYSAGFTHYAFYSYTNNYQDDVEVCFTVNIIE